MQLGTPSRTAWAAAMHRAAHQVLEQGRIFSDPLAIRILGMDAESIARDAEEHPSQRTMRNFIAVRTRFTEDALAASTERGTKQLVVLGAGLDTFAYRNNAHSGLRIIEVDHPDTQAWKRQLLADAAIPLPDSLKFAPVNFERQTLAEGLANAGFNCEQQSFFSWLGVVPYLTEDAVWSTLRFIAGLPAAAEVVFDYADPPESLSAEMRAVHDRRAARVAAIGEAWVTYFEAETLREKLNLTGFHDIEDLGPRQIVARYFPPRTAPIPHRGGHVVRASTS